MLVISVNFDLRFGAVIYKIEIVGFWLLQKKSVTVQFVVIAVNRSCPRGDCLGTVSWNSIFEDFMKKVSMKITNAYNSSMFNAKV